MRSPELCWQQLHNRLQWEDDPLPDLLASKRARRSSAGQAPWLRARTPFRESSALLRTFEGHTGPVKDCAVSSDGSIIVSAGDDATVRAWDVSTGAETQRLSHHEPALCCALSRDDRFVVAYGGDDVLLAWDLASGERVGSAELSPHAAGAYAFSADCAFSPAGDYVVFAADSGLARWTWPGRDLERFLYRPEQPTSCAVSPDGTLIVAGMYEGTLRLWDARSGAERTPLQAHGKTVRRMKLGSVEVSSVDDRRRGVTRCAFSRDGKVIVTASADTTVRAWDVRTGEERAAFHGHDGPVTGCAVSADGSLVASASGTTLKVWNLETADEVAAFEGHTDEVAACAFSPDGGFLVSASADGTLKLWDTRTTGQAAAAARRPWSGHRGAIFDCGVGSDGTFVVTAGEDGTVRVWDAEDGNEHGTIQAHDGWAHCVLSPDSSFVVSWEASWHPPPDDPQRSEPARLSHTLKVWDPRACRRIATLRGHSYRIKACEATPDSRRIVSLDADGVLKIWAAGYREGRSPSRWGLSRPWRCRATIDQWSTYPRTRRQPDSFVVGPDGTFVVLGHEDGAFTLIDAVTGAVGASLARGESAISPNGAFEVRVDGAGEPSLYEVATGEEVPPHTTRSTHGAGGTLGLSREGRALHVFDLATRHPIATVFVPGTLFCAAVHPQLQVVFCGDSGGNVYVFDLVR
jgi:WD40 repeat protein